MKVYFQDFFKGISGKRDQTIYYYHPKCNCIVARALTPMPHQAQNDKYAIISQRLRDIKPSAEYKTDLRLYLSLLSDTGLSGSMVNWYNLYVKLMWAMQKTFPETVNLMSITRTQIFDENLPCRSVKSAVEANLIPCIKGYEIFTAVI